MSLDLIDEVYRGAVWFRWPFLLVLTLGSQAGAATLVPLSQDRSVEVDVAETTHLWTTGLPGFDPPDSSTTEFFADAAAAPDFAPFNATAGLVGFSGTSASQSSSIGASAITATGSHGATAGIVSDFVPPPPFSQVVEQHDTGTSFSVTFELDAPCNYTLSGSVSTAGAFGSASSSFIRLTGPGPAVLAEVQVDSDPNCVDPSCVEVGPEPIDSSGTLGAGVYTLEAGASGVATGFYSISTGDVPIPEGGEFDFAFALATPVPASPLWSRGLAFLLTLAVGWFVAPSREPKGRSARSASRR